MFRLKQFYLFLHIFRYVIYQNYNHLFYKSTIENEKCEILLELKFRRKTRSEMSIWLAFSKRWGGGYFEVANNEGNWQMWIIKALN